MGGESYDYSVTQSISTKGSIIEVKAKIVYFFYEIDITF